MSANSKKYLKLKMSWRDLAFLSVLFVLITISRLGLALSTEEIALRVQQSYEQTKSLAMHFSQETYVELLERTIKKAGEAEFLKPGKFAIRYQEKGGREYISDGHKLWIYKNGSKQVQVYKVDQEEIPAEALSFLGGLGNLPQDFVVEDLDEKRIQQLKMSSEQQKKYHWLELTPRKKRSQISWLVMGFSPENYLAAELYLLTDSGNLSHYNFSQVMPNANLLEESFVFSKSGVRSVAGDLPK